ncbi:MAG TPA: ABC transporter permease [Vicinamibacterales bacterium]|nr:ABC transporter permease [Vicinamibacterales bacterium]
MKRHRLAAALHRLALRAYPAGFRRQFGADLDGIFFARLNDAHGVARRVGLIQFLLLDAVCSGLAERLRRRHERWAWPRHVGQTAAPSRTQTMTIDSFLADVKLAFRQFARAPLFAVLTVATLALGIGVNSAMFGVVQAVLLRPLPYDDAGALVQIWSDNTRNSEPDNPVSPGNYEAFKAAPSLADVEGMYSFLTTAQVRIGAEAESILVSQVTAGMFTLLGRAPVIGRTFDAPGAEDGAILTHQFWQRRLGGDPNVVGQTLTLSNGTPIPILGVMPEDFTFPYGSMLAAAGFTRSQRVDVWWPISRTRDSRLVNAAGEPNRGIHYFAVIGRLAPGATIDRARADLTAIARQREADYPDTNAGWGVTVRPLHEQTVGQLRPALLLLMFGVGVVLLITCINIANVLLARAAGRGRDLSIRSALGASGARLMQQTLIESLLLSVAGGVAALGVLVVATRAILAAAPADLPRLGEVSPGTPVILFALALAVLTGIVVGLLPAITAARSKAQDSLRDGTRSTASVTRRRARSTLIVAEVALAMALTVGAGLLLRSFVSVLGVDPGFRAEQLLTLQMSVPARYTTLEASLGFYDELEARLEALPGVLEVGGTTRLPLGSTNVTTSLDVEGRGTPRAEQPEIEMRRAVFDYFAAMEIPVLRGRVFTRADDAQAPAVVVINDALARRVFPGEDPLGRRVRFSPTQPWMPIIGVVGNVRHASLEETPRPELYITYRQGPPSAPYLVIRARDDAAALTASVRQAVRELGADRPRDIRTMEAVRSNSVAERRFVLLLVGLFGVLALGLAALGVFGVITLIAAERTTEVGIRMALGATPPDVLRMMLGQAVRLTGAGVLIGAVAAFALTPLLEAQLFGVSAQDPLTFVVVASGLLLTATAAAYLPARRAMRVDPVNALRA